MAGRAVSSRATSAQRRAFNALKACVWAWDGTPRDARAMAEQQFSERPDGVLSCYRAIARSLAAPRRYDA